MSDFEKVLLSQAHPEYVTRVEEFEFHRAAVAGKLVSPQIDLSGSITGQLEVADSEKFGRLIGVSSPQKYLMRFSAFESDSSWVTRQKLAFDYGYAGLVLGSYLGYLAGAETSFSARLSTDLDDKIRNNIDNQSSTIDQFAVSTAAEILGEGKCYVLVDKKEGAKFPTASIIPRERVIDFEHDDSDELEGDLNFIKYWEPAIEVNPETFERVMMKRIVFISRTEKVTALFDSNIDIFRTGTGQISAKHIERTPNPLGFVPVKTGQNNEGTESLISTPAKIQVDILNASSELRQIIRNQALSILAVPKGTKLETLSANSWIEIPAANFAPQWVAYPASGLDAHFNHLAWQRARVFETSNLRDPNNSGNLQVSGLSKQWDFLQTDAILSRTTVNNAKLIMGVIDCFAAWQGIQNPESTYTIKDEFSPNSNSELLDNILKTMAIGMDSISEKELKKVARDAMLDLKDEDREASDKLIDQEEELPPSTVVPEEEEEDEET